MITLYHSALSKSVIWWYHGQHITLSSCTTTYQLTLMPTNPKTHPTTATLAKKQPPPQSRAVTLFSTSLLKKTIFIRCNARGMHGKPECMHPPHRARKRRETLSPAEASHAYKERNAIIARHTLPRPTEATMRIVAVLAPSCMPMHM